MHLIKIGIQESGNNPEVLQISDEIEALRYAVDRYNNDALLFLAADDIENVLSYVEKLQTEVKQIIETITS